MSKLKTVTYATFQAAIAELGTPYSIFYFKYWNNNNVGNATAVFHDKALLLAYEPYEDGYIQTPNPVSVANFLLDFPAAVNGDLVPSG